LSSTWSANHHRPSLAGETARSTTRSSFRAAQGRPTPLLLIAAPRGIEDYFHQINTASTDDQHRRIGEGYGIHAAPRPAGETRACLTCLVAAQNDPICTVSMLITIKAELVQNGGSRA
jgi:hypothetical protein